MEKDQEEIKMAKKKRRKRQFTVPLAPIAGLAAGMHGPIVAAMAGDMDSALNQLSRNYAGYDINTKDFKIERLANGVVPLVIGVMVHKFVGGSPLNLNRTLAAAGVPFVRI